MYTFKTNIDEKEYTNFINKYTYANFMQEKAWANVKDNFDNILCGVYEKKKLIAACSILIRHLTKSTTMFYIPRGYYYIKNRFQGLLVEGSILNNTEVIRNFNGWAWNYQEDSQINQIPNMIYQSIRMLIGEDFLKEWENDSSRKNRLYL